MNTKDFIRLGIPLGEASRRTTDFISKFILAGGDVARAAVAAGYFFVPKTSRTASRYFRPLTVSGSR